jgi:hypothetical protein
MHPVAERKFTENELGKVVFFNCSAFGSPVKTAIFLGGQEFDAWMRYLKRKFNRRDFPPYDKALYRKYLDDKDAFLTPELVAGSGQFPGSKPGVYEKGVFYPYASLVDNTRVPPCFDTYEGGAAVLRISLVMQTLTALERASLAAGEEIYTEGGFRQNEAYNALLSAALPTHKTALTDIPEATALGAAMTARMALTHETLEELAGDLTVEYKEVPKDAELLPLLNDYREAWLKLL